MKPRSSPNTERAAEANSRLSQELESIRQKILDLEHLESELVQAKQTLEASKTGPAGMMRSAEQIRAEVETTLGFFPPFLAPASDTPEVLENLWRQSHSGYYANPLPDIFKEKLLGRLSRYCAAPYAIVVHSCRLYGLGMPAADVLRFLNKEIPLAGADLGQMFRALASVEGPIDDWAQNDPALEEGLLNCCAVALLRPGKAQRCNAELRRLLGPPSFAHMIVFLSFLSAYFVWLQAHPEIAYETDRAVRDNYHSLLQEEPAMAEEFRNYYEDPEQRSRAEKVAGPPPAGEDLYRDLFENAADMIYSHDLEGNLTSLNKAGERLTGYTRAEALSMKFADFVAPDSRDQARAMIDKLLLGMTSATCELQILAKDGTPVDLGISPRLIFREGKPVAVQGIARNISERIKTDEALQQAKKKLEAWVGELEERTSEMALLNEMGDMLRACLTIEEAYDVIARVAKQIFPVQVGALYVIASSRNIVESVVMWGETALGEQVFTPDECWALRRGRLHWVRDIASGVICKHIRHASPNGYLCVPMMAQSEALGILHLTQSENVQMNDVRRRLAITMAEHIAMSLSNLKLHETLRSQSIRDPLTGLFNRRFMEESLELEVHRASRNQRPLGVIMLDLDYFKHFNDTFGHEAGDTLLRELGTMLQSSIRGEDIACRYGGEEFALILPEASAEITRQRAEFLRETIQRMDVHHRAQPLGRITASLGVSVFPEHGRTGKDLLRTADAALYRSKDEGRDRVTAAR